MNWGYMQKACLIRVISPSFLGFDTRIKSRVVITSGPAKSYYPGKINSIRPLLCRPTNNGAYIIEVYKATSCNIFRPV